MYHKQHVQTAPQHRKRRIIFYDGDCSICRMGLNLAQNVIDKDRWSAATIQDGMQHDTLLGCPQDQALESMHVFDQGRHYHAFEAVAYLLAHGKTQSWLFTLLRWKPIAAIGQACYRFIARSRPCADHGCSLRHD